MKENIVKIMNMKSFLKDESKKGLFKSESTSRIIVTNGEEKKIIELPIRDIPNNSKVRDLFLKKYPMPKPPVIGEEPYDYSNPADPKPIKKSEWLKYKNRSGVEWVRIYDYEDFTYKTKLSDWASDISLLTLMEMWELIDEKSIKDFEEIKNKLINEIGLTKNHIQQIEDDIKNLNS